MRNYFARTMSIYRRVVLVEDVITVEELIHHTREHNLKIFIDYIKAFNKDRIKVWIILEEKSSIVIL
jgi:CDP-glycerol glycerophosphotransferase (TagB/SpsB family)